MEALVNARNEYKKQHLQQGLTILSDQEIYELNSKIQRLIEIAIKEVVSVYMFQTPDCLGMFERALKFHSKASLNLSALTKAYECLEKYFLQLVEQPWKQEFKKIKLYGGFYRTRIKSVLPEPESIFRHAGYSVLLDKQLLVLENPVQPDSLLVFAFDCRLCAELCRAITEHYEVVKSLSVSLDQAVRDILYGDRSRGRSGINAHVGFNQNPQLQVGLNPLGFEDERQQDYTAVPHIPKREPIVLDQNLGNAGTSTSSFSTRAANSMYTRQRQPGESADMMTNLANRKVERQPDHFEGFTDEHILRSLHAVGGLPYAPQDTSTAIPKNGHVEPIEWDKYYQLQMQRKRDKNLSQLHHLGLMNIVAQNPGVSVHGPATYPPTLAGRQNMSSVEYSVDEGIEKDISPVYKNPPYPYVGPKLSVPGSSLQSSFIDQGYNTANGSNGHQINLASGHAAQLQQPQQIYAGRMHTDGVSSPPIVPPRIPPRSTKPDFGVRGGLASTQDALAYQAPPLIPGEPQTQGKVVISNNAPVRTISMIGSQNGSRSSEIPGLSSSTAPSTRLTHSSPVLRKEQLRVGMGNSSSLKYNIGTGNKAVSDQAERSRASRSMDLTRSNWECPRCTTRNSPSDTMCTVCSSSRPKTNPASRNGSLASSGFSETLDMREIPGMSKKSCPVCTLENEPNRSHCSLCDAKLEDPYTYV
ncbi:protein tamozhennic [Plakobranchus ocellatus]|uniref:Protein tamozhennic n=1 Tax=Plakobranchus ocellatus TaxID=259542 RepID=A0AAV3Y5D3_9GAST|nr:protein tamozhennic [Plakobranchus ocellatus]